MKKSGHCFGLFLKFTNYLFTTWHKNWYNKHKKEMQLRRNLDRKDVNWLFDIGEYVSYGNNGICQVAEITNMQGADDSDRQYYILKPINSESGKIYTPIDNDKVYIRELITVSEAEKLLKDIASIEIIDIVNPRELDAEYKRRIRTGNWHMWVSIIKTIFHKRDEREKNGKKLTTSDERYLREVSTRLYDELSFVMNKEYEEVEALVSAAIYG
ncbi:MAG: hypothetical protein E7267_02425 [Lachnospiraceae bacterium]|nr:hypothetical protein [Lachnospiraceae bacterium]